MRIFRREWNVPGSFCGLRIDGREIRSIFSRFLDRGTDCAAVDQLRCDGYARLRKDWGKQVVASAEKPSATETPLHLAWQVSGDTSYLEKAYASQIETAADREFLNTEGSLWIDRIYFNNGELQRARLGGVALMRNYDYPGNVVSWRFEAPANDQSVAILIPEATPDHFKVIAYNLDPVAVKAKMTGMGDRSGQVGDHAGCAGVVR